MRVGFTGTRNGMSQSQQDVFRVLLSSLKATEFHHGDCVGADNEAANIAHDLNIAIAMHPPLNTSLVAGNPYVTKTFPAKGYLARNRDIVDEIDVLIGVPKERDRQSTGGTWYTIDYAKSKEKIVFIIFPDGKVTKYEEGWEVEYIT